MKKFFVPIATMFLALSDADVPVYCRKVYDGYQLCFPWCKGDVVCSSMTYGAEKGLVESYKFPWDEEDVTVMTIEEAIEKIKNLFFEKARG